MPPPPPAPPPASAPSIPVPGPRPALWAPRARTVDVVLLDDGRETDRRPLRLIGIESPGWWGADAELGPGQDYAFSVDDGDPVPDPRSPWQPQGVHGPSRTFDPAFAWTDTGWAGRDLTRDAVLRLDVGGATPQGTLDALADALGAVRDRGFGAVELAPVVAHDPGAGPTSGVRLYAVHEPYGGPRALQRFVDAAHAHGLAVVLDVPSRRGVADDLELHVLGPYTTGSRLPVPSPDGGAPRSVARPNLDASGSRGARDFLVCDAERWFEDFHVDGLRLDVDALVDRSPAPFLGELADAVARLGRRLGRPLVLMTDGSTTSGRLVEVLGGLLARSGVAPVTGQVGDLRRLAHAHADVVARRARAAVHRGGVVLLDDLARLPHGGTGPQDVDARAVLVAALLLGAATPVVAAPRTDQDVPLERLAPWTARLLELRAELADERWLPLDVVLGEDDVVVLRRGRALLALNVGDGAGAVRLTAHDLPGRTRLAAAWKPDLTRLEGENLTVPGRSAALVLRD